MTARALSAGRPLDGAVAALAAARDEVVDAGFLIVAVTLGLVGFRTTYGDYGYLDGAFLGLLAGVVIAYLAWKLAVPSVAALSSAVVAFFALGGAAALRSTAIGGVVPTGGTLRALASGSVHGWVDLLTLLPPLGSSGPLLVIPYLLGLSAGVTGYLLARRSRAPLLPAVAPAAVLATSILFGTHEPVSTLLQGGLFAIVVLAWGALRQARRSAATLGSTHRMRRLASAGVVLAATAGVALALGPHLPFAHSHSRVVMRTYVQPPFDPSAFASPLAGFRNYVNQAALRTKTLFTVKGLPRGGRIRLATMDVYDGLVWGVSNGAQGTAGAFLRVGSRIPPTVDGKKVRVRIVIKRYANVWLPDVGDTNAVTFSGPDAAALTSEFRYDLATGTAVVPGGLRPGDAYALEATIPVAPSARTLASAKAAGQTPDITNQPPAAAAHAAKWAGHGSSPYAALGALARRLRRGGYSDGGKNNSESQPGHSENRLQQFLTAHQLVGDDEQYAAAFALLANALGYPTRVVLGAIPEKGGIVKGLDVHAWDEVNLTGAGWVPFDVTPPRSHHPNPVPPTVVTVNHQPSRVPPPIQQAQPQVQSSADTTVSSSSKKVHKHHQRSHSASLAVVGVVARVAGPPILAIVLAVAAILLAKAERRRRRRRRGTPAQRVSAGWRELVDLMVDLGAPRPSPGTRRMAVRALDRSDLAPMAGAADAVNFGPGDPDDAVARQYWREVDDARRRLLADVRRRRRVAARLSLASLRGRRLRRRRLPEAVANAPVSSA